MATCDICGREYEDQVVEDEETERRDYAIESMVTYDELTQEEALKKWEEATEDEQENLACGYDYSMAEHYGFTDLCPNCLDRLIEDDDAGD